MIRISKELIKNTSLFKWLKMYSKPLRDRRDIVIWRMLGNPVPPPAIIKQRIVKEYREKYKLEIFIETGTYLGDMVNAVKEQFEQIYSIELGEKLFVDAKNRFSSFLHIHILQGDSAEKMREVLSQIDRPALFWLDAHYSGDNTAKSNKDTPILDEMNSILHHPIKNHVILIDDARCFNGLNDYPSLGSLKNYLFQKRLDYGFEVSDDIIRIFPALTS